MAVHVQSWVLHNIAVRIDLAFEAFSRRVCIGEKRGCPHFRGRACQRAHYSARILKQ